MTDVVCACVWLIFWAGGGRSSDKEMKCYSSCLCLMVLYIQACTCFTFIVCACGRVGVCVCVCTLTDQWDPNEYIKVGVCCLLLAWRHPVFLLWTLLCLFQDFPYFLLAAPLRRTNAHVHVEAFINKTSIQGWWETESREVRFLALEILAPFLTGTLTYSDFPFPQNRETISFPTQHGHTETMSNIQLPPHVISRSIH